MNIKDLNFYTVEDVNILRASAISLEVELEAYKVVFERLSEWANAYPLEVFPEPDFKLAANILKVNGMTLDAISASNMRHVLTGVKSILDTLNED